MSAGNGGPQSGDRLIEIRDLVKHFPLTKGILLRKQVGAVQAVDGVTFDVFRGETLGIVGASGWGKATPARLIKRPRAARQPRLLRRPGGSITSRGGDIPAMSRNELKPLRRDMQMIFQDPCS